MKFLCKFVTLWLVILSLVIIFPLLGGCSGPEKSGRLSELLTLMPADENVKKSLIMINDCASAYEAIGISLAELDEQSATFQEFVDLLRENSDKLSPMISFPNSFITGWGQYADTGLISNANVGYDFASLDAEIQTVVPPNGMVIAIGRYDPQATRNALKNQSEWPSWAVEAYDSQEYRGVTIYSWDDGFEIHLKDSLTPPHIDAMGRAMPLAVTEKYLFYAASVDTIKTMIDASQSKTESLADLSEYADIVVKMSGLGVYSLLLGDESIVNGNPEEYDSYSGPRLKEFITFGFGNGRDEDDIYTALILYHESSDDAMSNISLLEQRITGTSSILGDMPWTDIFTDYHIEVDGPLLIAKLYPPRLSFLTALVYSNDTLLLHEEQ